MSHRRSTVKGSLSFANPTVRAWLFQILAVVAVVGIIGWLFHNTVTNLSNRGITSGFAFLDRGAGFGIVQHLIDYQQGDTYGNVPKIVLNGLDANKRYRIAEVSLPKGVSSRFVADGSTFTGAKLMAAGIDNPLNKQFESAVLELRAE